MNGMEGNDDGNIIVATPEMCHYCFDVLLKELIPESALRRRASPSMRKQTKNPKASSDDVDGSISDDDDDGIDGLMDRLGNRPSYAPSSEECPLFVTWSKLRRSSGHHPLFSKEPSSGITTPASTTASSSNIASDDESSTQYDESDYDLRGCIGTLAPKPLDYALSEFAITSALHDQRFDPIALHEVPQLRVGVSLLVRYEECAHPLDWEVGVHGIIIKFEVKRRGANGGGERSYSATYLPEVAYEQGWSQREAVTSLVRKAGYRGAIGDDLMASIRCTRYQSSKHRMSYREYASARHGGADPLRDADVVTAAAVDEAIRRRARGTRPCVNL